MKKHHFIVVVIYFLFVSFSGYAQVNNAEQILQERGEVYFSFTISDHSNLEQLTRIISIDKLEGNKVFAYANQNEFNAFLELGYEFEIYTDPGFLYQPKMLEDINIKEIEDWDFYPTYEAYVDMMYQFESDYPDICKVFSIGQSVEGRELLVAKISDNVNSNEGEPEFLYTSTMHGNELTGYPLMLRLIDSLLTTYGTSPRITNLVDNLEIHINPLANPDGTYNGGNQTVYGATRYNANGIDLNRNYPDPEDGPHPDGNQWQTETLRFMEFAEDHHFVLSCNIHGGEEVCNYPWDTWQHLAVDDDWWQYVCHEYADTVHEFGPPDYMNGFDEGITNGYAWYSISGGRQDYMNYFHQCREFTLEISVVKTPPVSELLTHWEYNKRSFLNYIEQTLFGISGVITDEDNGDPIKAEIFIDGHDADSSWVYSSEETGRYQRTIFAGSYNVTYSAPGYYSQTISDINVLNRSNTTVDVQLVSDGSGTGELNMINYFSVTPNPCEDFLTIEYSKGGNTEANIKIYNIQGELINTWNFNFSNYQKQVSIPFADEQAGIYLLVILVENGTFSKKIIKR